LTNLNRPRPSLSAADRESGLGTGPDDHAAEQTNTGYAPSGEELRLVELTSRVIRDGIDAGLSIENMTDQTLTLWSGRVVREELKRSLKNVVARMAEDDGWKYEVVVPVLHGPRIFGTSRLRQMWFSWRLHRLTKKIQRGVR
jgi:hypothetical protein